MALTQHLKSKLIPIVIGLGITVFHLFWTHTGIAGFADLRDRLDAGIYDVRYVRMLDAQEKLDDRVIVVDMDEASMAAEGRWPWPRTKFAQLLEKLAEAGVAVVALDIMFTDEETNPLDLVIDAGLQPEVLGDQASALRERLNGDRAMASILSRHDIVVGFVFADDATNKQNRPPSLDVLNNANLARTYVPERNGILSNTEIINGAAQYQAFFSMQEDPDGKLRHYYLVNRFEDQVYPALALEAVRVYNLLAGINIEITPSGGIGDIQVGGFEVAADNEGRVLIPFVGKSRLANYISATDVLNERVPAAQLEGKIAFVGSTAAAQFDFISTPVEPNFPGLEVHAVVASGILQGNFPHRDDDNEAITLLTILLLGLLLSIGLPFLSASRSVATGSLLFAALVGWNLYCWGSFGLALDLALPAIMVILLIIANIGYGFIAENRAKQQITGMFGQYVPPDLVKQMSNEPKSALSFDGDRREMTVLFADIRSFTSISEGMGAAELKDMLNRYFTPMTQIIFEHQGTIDKYIGDMVMAFWGAPVEDENHAENSLSAALEMLKKTEALRPEFNQLGYPKIEIGIGLNSGEMNVGNMGSEYRRSYTVLGDNVNLGSRVEGLTKFYGVKCLVAQNTYELCQESFLFRTIDRVRVKGKEDAVALYEPIGKHTEVDQDTRFELLEYEEALREYFAARWIEAHIRFVDLAERYPERLLYQLYAKRTSGEAETPQKGWDGVYVHTSK